jgi:starch synthase
VNVLFVTSEVARYAKTGGLGDVAAALPTYLRRAGHDVRTFMPLYKTVDAKGATVTQLLRDVELRLGPHRYKFGVFVAERPGTAPVHLVDCPALYHRPGLYTGDPDEHLRFLFLSRAALDVSQHFGFSPDVVHCNDWQTALIPLLIQTRYRWDRLFASTRTVLTIHNIGYQGTVGPQAIGDAGLGDSANLFHQDQLKDGRVNFLLHGIMYADGVTTVSPTYAREIQTPEYGVGLDSFLRARSSTVMGILNGVDYDEWSPEKDKLIPHRYGPHDLSGKAKDKEALLAKMGLPYVPGVPVIGVVSRLVGQKGFRLLEGVMPAILRRHRVQLTVLGSGERRLERMFGAWQSAFPKQVAFYRGFSNELAHLIEAGADMFLMPSLYEPCGLNQMYSLKYGTVPIVHKTGGLADTVHLWDPDTGQGTGISFANHDAKAVKWAVEAGIELYDDKNVWRRLMQNGMAQDFSWETQAKVYERVYSRLVTQGRGEG